MESLIPSDHREDQFVFRSKFETEYTIIDYIGNGAYGTVYKCAHKHCDGKVVAVKLIEILSKYPAQEAKILKKLKHENILEIISDWSEHPPKKYKYSSRSPLNELTNGVFFIETEFCDLKSLHSWLCIPVAITDLHAKIILYQIAKGLEHLHSPDINIVHRDLKPENILLCTNALRSCAVAKIGDFGISREITMATMTKGVGTFCYKCPEVSSHTVKYKHKVDIYALGVIFCEMLVLGDCSISDLDNRDSALRQDKIKEEGFSISESCGEYLKDKVEERQLIEDMVRLPGEQRPEASAVIAKLLELSPNICNEKLPIPHIPEVENPHEFRLYGKQTLEKFTGIPKAKHVEMLTTLELNFVSVDAFHLISCLKDCINLRTIEMIIINDGDGLFPKIALPKLRKFFYRQLNGPREHYPYLTDARLESLLFFGPLEQLWENKMTVKVIVTKLSIVEIQHEDSQCSIYLMAAEGTKRLYDKLKRFENTISVYLLDHGGDSDFNLELDKLPGRTCLETLAVDLPVWNDTVNDDLHKFQNLKELYLSIYSKKYAYAGIDHRRLVALCILPKTIRILSLSDLNVDIQLKSGRQSVLAFDSLSLINCTFHNNFVLEQMDSSEFQVKSLNFFINEDYHEQKKIYEPTWELLDFLMTHEACKRFYFGTFQWAVESELKDELLPYVEQLGVPNNSQMFLFENNGVWKGKVVEGSEHRKLLAELRHRDKFSMAEKDAFQKPEQVEVLPISYACSRIPHFQTHRNLEPAFVLAGSGGSAEYISFTGLEKKSTVKKIHLKRVKIDADGFVFNLRGCKELVSLCLENVKVEKRFFGSVNLSNIKEFLYVQDVHIDTSFVYSIANFFDVERMRSTLFFNKNSFDDLWTKAINVLIGVDNTRVLEFNHEKGLIWLQCCNYASDIISKSGLLVEPTQKINTIIIHDCSGLSALTNVQSSSLTYLSLTKVDVDFTTLLESGSFPCLQSLFLEPNVESTELDLCKIPLSVRTVGLTSMAVKITANYTTCECLTLKDCVLPKDFADSHLPLLRVRKIGLLGAVFFVKHGNILNKLFDDENICRTIYIELASPNVFLAKARRFYFLLISLGLKDFSGFEVSRDSSGEWSSLNKFNVEDYLGEELTGSGIIKNQEYPTESL